MSQNETRVALVPVTISQLIKDSHEVYIEADAGDLATFSNAQYEKVGAQVISDKATLYRTAEIIVKVQPPVERSEYDLMREKTTYIGFLSPFVNINLIRELAKRHITTFSMEMVPRITRAQSMDALSSMATIAGYKAVLIAADRLSKIFPLMMTAAGTITPTTVLVLGAGVAGLQAIATAKRLGAKVEAFDPRPAVKEQVQSLGASFIEMEMPKDVETSGGYAKELSSDFLKKEQEAIAGRLPKVDVVICTAQVFGKRAPILITSEMMTKMQSGSVIVDLAAEQGGNCELTQTGKTIEHDKVTIVGAVNLAAMVPVHASEMYARNVTNLIRHLYQQKDGSLDFNDEITKGTCITHNGEIVHQLIKEALQQQGKH